jgi:hypothetical protein
MQRSVHSYLIGRIWCLFPELLHLGTFVQVKLHTCGQRKGLAEKLSMRTQEWLAIFLSIIFFPGTDFSQINSH